MPYAIKELFHTLQGEGANAGRAAVFVRFAGCNLWSGLERDRAGAICNFCDTDFVGTDGQGGGLFETPFALADAVAAAWRGAPGEGKRLVVCTGGEPLLQLDEPLARAFHSNGFEVAVETNGTRPVPGGADWVCLSPKPGSEIVVTSGDELKFIYPQPDAAPEDYAGLHFKFRYLQPMDGPDLARNTALAVEYCMTHPEWRLSLQTHKILGIP